MTQTGLEIKVKLDENEYHTGIKINKKELGLLGIVPNEFHGEWNYKISPNNQNGV